MDLRTGFDNDGRPLTTAAAKLFIEKISRRRGNISERDELEIGKTSADWQTDYRRDKKRQRKENARIAKIISSQHTNKFQFIYEILQNSDDAFHTEINGTITDACEASDSDSHGDDAGSNDAEPQDAESSPESDDAGCKDQTLPELTFRLRPTELIVETNEMGFAKANVEAICSTAQSSKLNDLNATGEKGLGFKSVFRISNYVHIESGNWSFRFEHNPGDDGSGMISPIWTEFSSEDMPTGITTRFRLRYTQQSQEFVKRIVTAFEELPSTIIFALRAIQRMSIVFEDAEGRNYEKIFEWTREAEEHISISTTVLPSGSDSINPKASFRVKKSMVDGLPENFKRLKEVSEVVLGFQISPDGEPVIPNDGHQVFAYLPVTRVSHLPFAIHADFELPNNREQIQESDWNMALVKQVVKTFVEAVESFSDQSDELCYRWTDYVPFKLKSKPIWTNLYTDIKSALAQCEIIESDADLSFKRLADLRAIPERFSWEGNPLFPDLKLNPLYISEAYSLPTVLRLQDLGLPELSTEECLKRLEKDVQHPKGQLQTTELTSSWHSQFLVYVDFLLGTLLRDKIRKLKIILLSNGDWVSPVDAEHGRVYLPYLDEASFPVTEIWKLEIPDRLGIRKLHVQACTEDRRRVYMKLGVEECRPSLVIDKIVQDHRRGPGDSDADLVKHFEVLFWYWRIDRSQPKLIAFDEEGIIRLAEDLFFRSKNPMEAANLLGEMSIAAVPGYGFIHNQYILSPMQSRNRHGKTWMTWLEEAGVKSYPPLIRRVGSGLHPLLKVASANDSAKFLESLKLRWGNSATYNSLTIKQKPALRDDLRNIKVRCNTREVALSESLLPTERALSESSDCGVEHNLPFIKLIGTCVPSGDESWSFLRQLGVLCGVNLDFYLRILLCLKSDRDPVNRKKGALAKAHSGVVRTSTHGDKTMLKREFSENKLVCASPCSADWYAPEECLWDAPEFLWTMPTLKSAYDSFPDALELFCGVLDIRDAEYDDVLNCLKEFRHKFPMPASLEQLCKVYQAVYDYADEDDLESLPEEFDTHALLYADCGWIRPSQAIWSRSIPIPGLHPISHLYETLKDFFLEDIEVCTEDVPALLEHLKNMASSGRLDGQEVRTLMLRAGEILAEEEAEPDGSYDDYVMPLQTTKFLPIKNGEQSKFVRWSDKFYIVDNERYGEDFKDVVDLLDFTYKELTYLHPLFQLLRIEDRYLSLHVESDTYSNPESSHENVKLSNHLRERAYALSCCALFHQSPKYINRKTAFHNLLLTAKVFLSDDMWTNLYIKSLKETTTVRSGRVLVQIKTEGENLKIYAPLKDEVRSSCYRTELPAELVRILGIEHYAEAHREIYRILNDDGVSLNRIMEDEQIPQVSWLEKYVTSWSEEPVASLPTRGRLLREPAQDTQLPSAASDSSETQSQRSTTSAPPFESSIDEHQSPSPSSPSPQSRSNVRSVRSERSDNAYRLLLESVVRQARKLPTTQPLDSSNVDTDTISMSELRMALEDDNSSSLPKVLGMNEDEPITFNEYAKIGAAGELFVFERLTAIGIPNFTVDNWQSRIRHLVNVLSDYNLDARRQPEESDLVYETDSYTFEAFLRSESVNKNFATWPIFNYGGIKLPKIKYLIEVKATTGPSNRPFYMSRHQYQLMEDHALTSEKWTERRPPVVYVIFRVFNLGSDNIGMKIFVDPWRLKGNVLRFTTGPWEVTCT